MKRRYFFIEPSYSDPDTFCRFLVGGNDVRSSLSMYADISLVRAAARALGSSTLSEETPEALGDDWTFGFQLSVLPHNGGKRVLRFQFVKLNIDEGSEAVDYKTDIRFLLTKESAEQLSKELLDWCEQPNFVFEWAL